MQGDAIRTCFICSAVAVIDETGGREALAVPPPSDEAEGGRSEELSSSDSDIWCIPIRLLPCRAGVSFAYLLGVLATRL